MPIRLPYTYQGDDSSNDVLVSTSCEPILYRKCLVTPIIGRQKPTVIGGIINMPMFPAGSSITLATVHNQAADSVQEVDSQVVTIQNSISLVL